MTTYQDKHAFPIMDTGHGSPFDRGMTLRDYFAGQALTTVNLGIGVNADFYKRAAIHAYDLADAMLKARE